jgi:hypothetical protein
MNASSTTVRSLDRDHPVIITIPTPRRRVSLIDRIALRLGLWLILRGDRAIYRPDAYASHGRVRANELARREREARAFRAWSERGVR